MSQRNPRDAKTAAFDEVARNQIWREQLRKEYEQESTLTPFQLNLKTRTSLRIVRVCSLIATPLSVVHSIPLKPTQVHPTAFAAHAHERQDGSQEVSAKLQAFHKKHNEKSNAPQTETQRIG